MNETYYQKVRLPSGEVHVYAGPELFASLDYKVFEMANNNLQIPNQAYMSYTPDVHVGVGTCIGTTAVWHAKRRLRIPLDRRQRYWLRDARTAYKPP